MNLRGINFGSVWTASGAVGFYGEGWWYHRLLKMLGWTFAGTTLVAKTTTLHYRKGNMPKRFILNPRRYWPDCIKINWRKNFVLNAVGLSGPGLAFLLASGEWQKKTKPFFISFMSVADNADDRLKEVSEFVLQLSQQLRKFKSKCGVQLNVSCPNVQGHQIDDLVQETHKTLDILSLLGIPLVIKISVTTPIETAMRIAEHPQCDGLCISNTVPFGQLEDYIDWEKLFGSLRSPLARYGGGGLSGEPIRELVVNWVANARRNGLVKPINAGGGILCPDDVDDLVRAGLQPGKDSIFVGSIALLRPRNLQPTIKRGYQLLSAHTDRSPVW